MNLQNGSLLQNGKYRIVSLIGCGHDGYTYDAIHMLLNSHVEIHEFFMSDCCVRNVNTMRVEVAPQADAQRVRNQINNYMHSAKASTPIGSSRVIDVFEENGTAYYVNTNSDAVPVNKSGWHGGAYVNMGAYDDKTEVGPIASPYDDDKTEVGPMVVPPSIGGTGATMPPFQPISVPIPEPVPRTKDSSNKKGWIGLILGIVGGMLLMASVLFAINIFGGGSEGELIVADSVAVDTVIMEPEDSIAVAVVEAEEPEAPVRAVEPAPVQSEEPSAAAQIRAASARNGSATGTVARRATARTNSSGSETGTVSRRATARIASEATTGVLNGHDWVDLGLSVKWATCNVGANTPTGYGDHLAWGEIYEASGHNYDDDACRLRGQVVGSISGNGSYDAARSRWGSGWRMPTKAEFQELLDKCTWTWTSRSGCYGYEVKSRSNSNSIFLPATGWYYGSSLLSLNDGGNYWTSSPYESNEYGSHYVVFDDNEHYMDWLGRSCGLSVRPVCD